MAGYLDALNTALDHLDLQQVDGAAVQLARGYAEQLDGDGDLVKLGPLLLATLGALGMTPAGRTAILGKGAPTREPPASPLDELRQRRERRHRATTVDAPAS